jgi:hypothetical protein
MRRLEFAQAGCPASEELLVTVGVSRVRVIHLSQSRAGQICASKLLLCQISTPPRVETGKLRSVRPREKLRTTARNHDTSRPDRDRRPFGEERG